MNSHHAFLRTRLHDWYTPYILAFANVPLASSNPGGPIARVQRLRNDKTHSLSANAFAEWNYTSRSTRIIYWSSSFQEPDRHCRRFGRALSQVFTQKYRTRDNTFFDMIHKTHFHEYTYMRKENDSSLLKSTYCTTDSFIQNPIGKHGKGSLHLDRSSRTEKQDLNFRKTLWIRCSRPSLVLEQEENEN